MGRLRSVDRKEAILLFLKVRGEASLAELAERMEVTKQGALRHVEGLEERGLIERVPDVQVHDGPGRLAWSRNTHRAWPASTSKPGSGSWRAWLPRPGT